MEKHSSPRFNLLNNFLVSKGFYVGFGLYLLSFFLPAVFWAGEVPLPGWTCAWMSLWVWTDILEPHPSALPFAGSVLAFFGGLINPLAIVYAILRGRNKAPKLRTSLSNTILWCIPFTWLCLLVLKMGVRVGHIVWIVGLLLMIFSEAATQHDFSFTRYGSGFAVLVLGWCGYHWVITPTLAPITDRDEFFYSVAVHFKAPQVCNKIGRYDEGGFSDQPGYQIAYLQSRCFYDLAQITKDVDLCTHVRPLNYENQDGTRYSPEGCKEQVPDPVPQLSAYLQRENFVKLMGSAGFEAAAMAFRRERYRNDAGFFDLYEQARQDTAFLDALHRMRNHYASDNIPDWRKWPRDPARPVEPRPATGPEYLLAMVASDETDIELCYKIPDAAGYKYPDGRTFSLRSRCMFHVIFYSRQGLCDYVASPENNFDAPLASNYDSSASCKQSLQTERYPDWGEPTGSEPMFFTDRQSFQAALDEAGYVEGRTAGAVPKPTYDDYIEFFYHAAEHESPEVRSDFVQQVMSIR